MNNCTILFAECRPIGKLGKKGVKYPKNRRTRLATSRNASCAYRGWLLKNMYPVRVECSELDHGSGLQDLTMLPLIYQGSPLGPIRDPRVNFTIVDLSRVLLPALDSPNRKA